MGRGEAAEDIADARTGFCGRLLIEWETVISFDDNREDYGEERQVCLGLLRGQWVVVAYTFRGDALRVISMRKASRR